MNGDRCREAWGDITGNPNRSEWIGSYPQTGERIYWYKENYVHFFNTMSSVNIYNLEF